MKIKIKCFECDESYFCNSINTRVLSSMIETTCPKCNKVISRNFSAFLDDQTKTISNNIIKASNMIYRARMIGKLVNEERLK